MKSSQAIQVNGMQFLTPETHQAVELHRQDGVTLAPEVVEGLQEVEFFRTHVARVASALGFSTLTRRAATRQAALAQLPEGMSRGI